MDRSIIKRIAGIMISTAIIVSFMPSASMPVLAGELPAGSDEAAFPAIEEADTSGGEDLSQTGSESGESYDESESEGDMAGIGSDEVTEDPEEEFYELIEEESAKADAAASSDGTLNIDPEITGGQISASIENNVISGTASADAGFDLASIRLLQGEDKQEYIDFAYNKEGDPSAGYSFSYEINGYDPGSITLTATFFSTEVWDGAVDISWYDPEKSSFDISTPAQLAGLAVIVDGMTDPNETRDDQIKSPVRADIAKYVSSEPFKVQLLEQQGGGVDDIAWRQIPSRTKGILGADDLYNDMRYRTINITRDIDMGTEHNYIPIGGKFAMIVKNDSALGGDEVKVIDTRFHGIFNGNGHTITVNCNRYSSKGYGYTWNVGLIGYLGGGVDTDLNSAKDNKIEEYVVSGYAPAVRNVVLRGSIKGRRGTGGIVGRIGQTNGTVVVEKCANYATVRGTDKVGCGGIVGAPWGKSVIRNCYNAGTVRCSFEEVGGIVGSNGYGWKNDNRSGADIYNCFNIGDVQNAFVSPGTGTADEDRDVEYGGHEIGFDGNAAAEYTIRNCFYIEPDQTSEFRVTGYDPITNNNVYMDNVRGVTAAELNGADVLAELNSNGNVFAAGDGHPVLYFEKGSSQENCTVSTAPGDHGKVRADGRSESFAVPYGTTVTLTADADDGYRIGKFTADGKEIPGNFYTVTGDTVFSGTFPEKGRVTLAISQNKDYKITVRRKSESGSMETLQDGDVLMEGDVLEVTATLNEGSEPSDVNYEYTGRFSGPGAVDPDSVKKRDSKTLEVTGTADVTVKIDPVIQLKDWVTYADTSWYFGHESDSVFTLTTPQQLAGMAKILCDGNDYGGTDFKGKTIRLGSDIDLTNPDARGGNRLWRTVGNNYDNFKGTFDGCGYTIRNIYVSHTVPVVGIITGNHGGLFGFTEDAVIKNLTIEGKFWATAGDTGVFAGDAKNTLIENCVSRVEISNCKETGGIVGKAEGTTIIRNCSNEGSIGGMHHLAGIASRIGTVTSGTNNVVIESCVNRGDVSGTFYNNAGLVAKCETKAAIRNSVNYGNINCTQTAVQSDPYCAEGGLVALVSGALTVDSCANLGSVTAERNLIYAGGIAGLITVNTASIVNCYNSGDVTSNSESASACIAGLANFTANRYPKLENCYNRGIVTVGEKFATKNYGGVAGLGKGDKIANTYCTVASAAGIDNTAGIGGEIISQERLKIMAPELGEAFVPDTKAENDGFPVLKWQNPDVDTSVAKVTFTTLKKSGTSKAVLTWTAEGNADGYEILRSDGKKTAFRKVAECEADKLTYTDTGLKPGTLYYYEVVATRDVGGTVYHGDPSEIKYLRISLGKTVISKVSNTKKSTVVVKWKRVSTANGYEVYRSTKKTKGFKKIATVKVTKKNKKLKVLSYINKKLKKGKTYYYKVRFYRNISGKKVYGDFSAVKRVKIKK